MFLQLTYNHCIALILPQVVLALERGLLILLLSHNAYGDTFYFIRHGQSEWNKSMIKLGLLDLPLTNVGRDQALSAQIIMENLVLFKGKVNVIASPYIRALQTAEILCNNHDCLISIDPRLRKRTLDPANPEDKQFFFTRIKSFLAGKVPENAVICSHAEVFNAFKELLKIKSSRQIKMGEVVKFVKRKGWQIDFMS